MREEQHGECRPEIVEYRAYQEEEVRRHPVDEGVGVCLAASCDAGQLAQIVTLLQQVPEVVECHRITGEDCFILKVHIPAMDQLDRLLDQLLLYGSTTTSIVQSSPISIRPLPLPEV